MYEHLTAAAAREHVRDLRTHADRDRTLAQARRNGRRRERAARAAVAR